MNVELSKQQYRDLLLAVTVGLFVREGVQEMRGKDFSAIRDIERHLLSYAERFGAEDVVETFRGERMVSDELSFQTEDIINEYNDETFWNELKTRLGQRDFARDVGADELQRLERAREGLPEKIFDYYEKYETEFVEHGIENLEIVKEKISK